MIDIHYLGTVYVCKAAWPHFQKAGYGRVVNTASEAVIGNVPKAMSYSGAKGAVYSFTRALALDGRAPEHHGQRDRAPRQHATLGDARCSP